MNSRSKIFVIGLPRTGTTSFCRLCLDLGLPTAHTAYTNKTFTEALVLADTPIFANYNDLDAAFPNSKFVYLKRSFKQWRPSIAQLLERMQTNLQRAGGGFNPYIKHSFSKVFGHYSVEQLKNERYLSRCYEEHEQRVCEYFMQRDSDLLSLDVAEVFAGRKLVEFLHSGVFEDFVSHVDVNEPEYHQFPHLNKGGKVIAWNKIRHSLKVESTRRGKIDNNLACLPNFTITE